MPTHTIEFTFTELIIIILIFMFIGFAFGARMSDYGNKKEAIEAGVAEWSIDSTTGEKQFQYIKIQ